MLLAFLLEESVLGPAVSLSASWNERNEKGSFIGNKCFCGDLQDVTDNLTESSSELLEQARLTGVDSVAVLTKIGEFSSLTGDPSALHLL